MASRVLVPLGFVLVCASIAFAQAPAAAPPANGFLAPATAGPPANDADKAFVDQMQAKKVIYKASVKGKLASLWVGEAFQDLQEEEKTRIVRLAYKYLVIAKDEKFKSPMTVVLSDGQRQGPRVGLYTITPKGDKVTFVKPRKVEGPVGGVFPPGFNQPQQPCPANPFCCM